MWEPAVLLTWIPPVSTCRCFRRRGPVSISSIGTTGAALARENNDMLADVVRARPDRFAAFALLAMQDPEGAALELERCVVKLGFKGALISGTINDRFLDDPRFEPVLAQAEKLDVPLYLHPAPPPARV